MCVQYKHSTHVARVDPRKACKTQSAWKTPEHTLQLPDYTRKTCHNAAELKLEPCKPRIDTIC